jgi:hypothetical protein
MQPKPPKTKSKKFPPPPKAILIRDLHHVVYEIQMLWQAAVELPETQPKTFWRNACLESLVIHARGLLEFYSTKRKTGPESMRATDFILKFAPIEKHNEHVRMHREVGHLTYERKQRGEQRGWNAAMAAPILRKSVLFLQEVSTDLDLMSDAATKQEVQSLLSLLTHDAKKNAGIEKSAIPASVVGQSQLYGSSTPATNTVDQFKGPITFLPSK